MSDEPELRDGPPWAMEEMIEAEPGLVEPILALEAVAEVASWVAGEPVVLVGCGTSEHAAMGGAAMLREAGVRAVARDAFEASLDPQQGGVLVAISHEAGTAATLDAAAAARERGARTALVTARPGQAPEGFDAVLGTPLRDTSWCHTVGYLSPLLALYAVAAREPDIAAVRALVDAALARREDLAAAGAALSGCERILAVASGADEVTARELALKIEEGAHVPVTPLGMEKVLHGHLPAADARTGVVVLRLDPRAGEARDRRAGNVLAATAALEMPAALIGPGDGMGAAASAALPVPADLSPVAGAILSGALAAQLVTLGLVMAAGTNPDLIRREEPRYRAAAEVGGAG